MGELIYLLFRVSFSIMRNESIVNPQLKGVTLLVATTIGAEIESSIKSQVTPTLAFPIGSFL